MNLKPVDFDPFADTPQVKLKRVQGNPFAQDPKDVIGQEAANPDANVLGMNVQGETSGGFNPAAAIIGAGQMGDKLVEGTKQAGNFALYALKRLAGGGQSELDALDAQKQQQAENDRLFAKLQKVNPGSTMAGQVAAVAGAPVRALPLVAGMEYGDAGERALKAGAALAGNMLVKQGATSAKKSIESQLAERSQKVVQDANVSSARARGYVGLPSEIDGGMAGKVVEGLTGKIKAGQLASVKNQSVTDSLVRKAFGLSEDAPLTLDTMRQVRAQAFESGYAPLREWGGGAVRIKPDTEFLAEASKLTSRADNASKAFGDIVKSDLAPLVDGLKSAKPFTPAEGVDAIAVLREKASDLFTQGNKTAGKAYKDAAELIEAQLERTLTKSGKDASGLVAAYKEARKTMAKSFDAEKAINRGRDGMVNAQALASILRKAPDRLTGELRTVAEAASSMPQATRIPQAGWANPLTAVDSGVATLATAASGNLLPILAPVARVAGRYGMFSKAGQKMLATPKREPSLLLRGSYGALSQDEARRLGGLLGFAGAQALAGR